MTEKIADLLAIKFEEADFQDCYVVEIKLATSNKLEVYIDSDSGMTFQKCQKISRYLESFIDENKWLPENYVLEVSSPGVDRPLTSPRQYQKNIGRKLKLKIVDEKAREGVLVDVREDSIVIEEKTKPKEKGKKKAIITEVEIPFATIKQAKIKLDW